MSPRTITIEYFDRPSDYWLTDRIFLLGDKLDRHGREWTVVAVANPDTHGNHCTMNLRERTNEAPGLAR